MMQRTQTRTRFASTALAVLMALLLAASGAVGGAWAAMTGMDYSSGVIDVTYGTGDSIDGQWNENILTVDDEWVYCADIDEHFAAGVEVSVEDPVATGRWSQDMVTELALASDFIWAGKFRTSSTFGDGHLATDPREKYALTQVYVWTIMDNYGFTDHGWYGAQIDGVGLTGADDGHDDLWAYVDEMRATSIGHANYYHVEGAQSVVCGFWVERRPEPEPEPDPEPEPGGINLVKRSANPSVSKNNDCYSLKGAVYGVFKTRAKAKTRDAENAIRTFKTDDEGKWRSDDEFDEGTYFVTEMKPSKGFALDKTIYEVNVVAGKHAKVNADVGSVNENPQNNPVKLWAKKSDAETANGKAQGSATLEHTLFQVDYYDGYYNKLANLPDAPTRSWTIKSGEDGKAHARDDLKVSGDEFYRTEAGEITIPLGTVTIREVAPPAGYALGDGTDDARKPVLEQIKADDDNETVSAYTAPGFTDKVKRGGVRFGKIDRQNGKYRSQGGAKLEGATFSIVSRNDQKVIVDGTAYSKGKVVKTIKAKPVDGKIIAQTAPDCLPVGHYSVYESASSTKGYLYDEASKAWGLEFDITEDGQMVDLNGEDAHLLDLSDESNAAANQVVRGDFSFTKANELTGEHLALVPFLVTSETTGEAHVIMTDKDGVASTASSWNAHTQRTNANDAALVGEAGSYTVDEKKLDPEAGVWFNGSLDAPCDPDDELGALPYDTYRVDELPASTNEGFEMAHFSVTVERHAHVIDLETVNDKAIPTISTTLADANDQHVVAAGEEAALIDTVHYTNLDSRETYTLEGSLHLVTEEGTDGGEVALANKVFSPTAIDGDVEVEFSFDSSALEGVRLVAFERLLDESGTEIASHRDLADEGQTVRIPTIQTTLVERESLTHDAPSAGEVELVDTVAYSGLTPGVAYTVCGVLHVRGEDGSDQGCALDENGKEITASQSFIPEAEEGEVEVTFTFKAPGIAGKQVVAFEELACEDVTYAVHADINDPGQTVSTPAIATTLTDGADDDHEATATETITLIDTVSYTGLTAGESYTMTGTLHLRGEDGSDQDVALDSSGNPISASQSFTPESPEGEVEVVFTFAAPDLAGKTVVAFEELYWKDRLFAAHADIADEGQTLRFTPPDTETGEPPKKTPPTTPETPPTTPPSETPPPETPPTTPPSETPPPETPPTTPPTSQQTGKATLPKTGDGAGIAVLAATALLATAAAGVALHARIVTRRREIRNDDPFWQER